MIKNIIRFIIMLILAPILLIVWSIVGALEHTKAWLLSQPAYYNAGIYEAGIKNYLQVMFNIKDDDE